MADPAAPPISAATAVRRGVLAALCLAGLVVALVWINRVAIGVFEIGGSCASGGPYVSARPCPEGTWMIVAGIWGGLAMAFAYGVLAVRGGPNWFLFAWPALFVSLGVQFARAATESQATVYGLNAVLFLVMGAGPLVAAAFSARRALWRSIVGDPAAFAAPDQPARRRAVTFTAEEKARLHAGAQRALASRRRADASRRSDPAGPPDRARPSGAIVGAPPATDPAVATPAGVADALDRIVAMHRQDLLSDEEFAVAKRQVLGLDQRGSS